VTSLVGTVIDCGAYTGEFCEYALYRWPNARVFAFEANPHLAESLGKRFIANDRIEVISGAAWYADEVRTFFVTQRLNGSTLFPDKLTGGPKTPILVRCLDLSAWLMRVCDLTKPIILKMNVEGAEYDILLHMHGQRTLRFVTHLCVAEHVTKVPSLLARAQQCHEILGMYEFGRQPLLGIEYAWPFYALFPSSKVAGGTARAANEQSS
jgi:FkbM family methyltransferase